jgi:hypothetical protein
MPGDLRALGHGEIRGSMVTGALVPDFLCYAGLVITSARANEFWSCE